MDIFDIPDDELYKQMGEDPAALVLKSTVPTSLGREKQFRYLYVDKQKYMLGEGSFGRVLVCFYLGGDRTIKLALKIIDIPQGYDQIKSIEHIVSTSRQQVLALIKLRQNKHIIRIEDIVRERNKIYIMLQFCNERDLMYYFKKLKNQEIITKQIHVKYFFSQILEAFKQLHQHNFMHRDIKPSNILVSNGVLKIADFGLSRQIFQGEEWKSFQEHVGTMITAAPQIVFKQQYTSKCDIYSLGTILYWMIYDRFPFTKVPTIQDFTSDKLEFPISTFNVSPQMIILLKQMLMYKQSDRIEWIPLLKHQLFSRQDFADYEKKIKSHYEKLQIQKLRQTYGRNITNALSDEEFLDTAIPTAYYKFLKQIQGEEKFKRWQMEERKSLLNDTGLSAHKQIKDQYKNQQIRLKLYRTILLEIASIDFLKLVKQNRNEAQLMKNIVEYSIYKFMIYLMKKIKDELIFVIPPEIFDIKNLRQAQKQPLHKNFIDTVIQKFRGWQYMKKFSEQEIRKIIQKCKDYHLYQDLGVVFEQINEGNISSFLIIVDQCIIETIYFLKPELNKFNNRSPTTPRGDNNNLNSSMKTLIVIINHLFMFSMQDKIFPESYNPQFPYSTFLESETEKNNFKYLQHKIFSLIKRFQ